MKISRWYLVDSDVSCQTTVAEVRDVDGEVAGWIFADSAGDGLWRIGFSTDFEGEGEDADVHTLADGLRSRGAAEVAAESWVFMLAAPGQVGVCAG